MTDSRGLRHGLCWCRQQEHQRPGRAHQRYARWFGTVSKGTTAECSDPCRTCLVGYLASASCQPVNRIEHIYRRDDKSGTQDTFREKVVDGQRRQPGQVLVQRQVRGQQQPARRQHQERGSGPDSPRLRG
jgi:hypothetical protein